ncbi:clustered mitochondria protein-like [Quercus robur]|uniref:clustered mitochondria protein-like n=1 Tax=Quercus robur TaxID=38942 RepID=UPI0021629CE7|nr:clustered mitochondria protein-like [Quercus robur]
MFAAERPFLHRHNSSKLLSKFQGPFFSTHSICQIPFSKQLSKCLSELVDSVACLTEASQKGLDSIPLEAQHGFDILFLFWWVLGTSHLIFNVARQAHPDLIQAFQAVATVGGSGSLGTSVNKSLNAAIVGDNPPQGRGVDERAARAATEVRKKATARGLLIHPHGVSVQAMPPLTQLLNIINSCMTPDATEGGETDGVKKEANGHPSNGPVDSKND